ncbi:MAG: hypothetical protein K6T75_11400 [Acetobacteraceae bacterium]|nr:hypothetical protein [Acetobacteraceae bacterium]
MLARLESGDRVRVAGQVGHWLKVELPPPAELEGFVFHAFLRSLEQG